MLPEIEKVDGYESNSNTIETISYIALFSTGLMMAIIRIFDPFYRFLIQ